MDASRRRRRCLRSCRTRRLEQRESAPGSSASAPEIDGTRRRREADARAALERRRSLPRLSTPVRSPARRSIPPQRRGPKPPARARRDRESGARPGADPSPATPRVSVAQAQHRIGVRHSEVRRKRPPGLQGRHGPLRCATIIGAARIPIFGRPPVAPLSGDWTVQRASFPCPAARSRPPRPPRTSRRDRFGSHVS